MITIEQTENLVNVAVLGEFTIADFKTFEEQALYKLKSPGELDLLFDLRAMVGYTIDVALGRDQVLPPRTQPRLHQDRRGDRQPVAHLDGMAVAQSSSMPIYACSRITRKPRPGFSPRT